MGKKKAQEKIWLNFYLYEKGKGFPNEGHNKPVYLDFKVPASPPSDLTFKGPFAYRMRFSCDGTLEFDAGSYIDTGDVWETFYTHATFREILRSQDEHLPYAANAKLPEFTSPRERFTIEEFKASLHEFYKHVLPVIADKPEILSSDSNAVLAIRHFLEMARYSIDPDKANEARNIIRDNLLPDFKKYKKHVLPLPEMLRLMRQLMVKLAGHLSGECIRALKRNYSQLTKRDINNDWGGFFSKILSWSKKNDGRIYEISQSKASLKKLVFKPSFYVDNLIQTYYKISPRTLKGYLVDK